MTPSVVPDASRTLSPTPGLRGRIKVAVSSTIAVRPRSVIFRRGLVSEIGRESPLRKMTSAAYILGRDSVAEGIAVGCHLLLCPRQRPWLEGDWGTKSKDGTSRRRGVLLVSDVAECMPRRRFSRHRTVVGTLSPVLSSLRSWRSLRGNCPLCFSLRLCASALISLSLSPKGCMQFVRRIAATASRAGTRLCRISHRQPPARGFRPRRGRRRHHRPRVPGR